MNGHPVIFHSPAGACTGWFHRASANAPAKPVGVLLCPPLGYEALCAHAAYGQLARALAAAGYSVMRFDYHGTGDAAGGDTDADRVGAWLGSVDAAADELKRLSGATTLSYFGMRLGATLAVEAAAKRGDAGSIVLWAPCPTGRHFVREMKAANASHANHAGDAQASQGLEALGTLFTDNTLQAVGKLDALLTSTNAERAPAPHLLVIGRDDLPAEGPLPARWRELGAQVVTTTWPGYSDLMAEPRESLLTPFALSALTDWLDSVHPASSLAPAAPRAPADLTGPEGFTDRGVHETPLSFGERQELFGVLSEPAGSAALGSRASTAVLMLNVGGNYHVGCNRIYVKAARELAQAGYRALRFDVAGMGDSHVGHQPGDSPYRHQSMGDVSAAIDALAAKGCTRFCLLGICSGSYLAFETAQRDARVTSQMLLNSRLLEWDSAQGPWQTSMQKHYKSTRHYQKQMLRVESWKRLVRGQVDVRGIARRFWDLGTAYASRVADTVLRRTGRDGVLGKMRKLCARGVDSFVIMSAEDDGLDYIEFHLGRRGSRLQGQPNFRMALIEDSDHTFSTVSSQKAVIDLVKGHLDMKHAPHETCRATLMPSSSTPAATQSP